MSEPVFSACTALVVGAGPVGLTLAAHLHQHGLPCRIIDQNPAPSDKSKALVLWGRTLEMLDDLGVVENFTAAGMFLNGAGFYSGSQVLAHLTLNVAGTEYSRPLMLAQSETERLLSEHLQRVGIPIERSVQLTHFTDDGKRVIASMRLPDGREEQVVCNWLLGCDGAHSTVRKQLDLEFIGAPEPHDWILADCRVEGPVPLDEVSIFWHAKGVMAFFPFTPLRCRIIAERGGAQGEGHPPDPTLADVQAIVDERGLGGTRLSEPHWLASFRINERKVAEYRHGRVFLVGDAAHIHSPAGGQGMNTGMQDAWNLAWKLALVQDDKARPQLLDSYSSERSAVGEMVLHAAGRLTTIATLRNPLARFFRNQLVRLLGKSQAFRRQFVRQLAEMTIHYPQSPLNGESQRTGWTAAGIRPGDRFPDAHLREPHTGEEERLMRILRGAKHNLLLLPEAADRTTLVRLQEIRNRVMATYRGLIRSYIIVPGSYLPVGSEQMELVWLDAEGEVRRTLGARETALALIRPDGYVSYRGQPASFEDLFRHVDRYLFPQA